MYVCVMLLSSAHACAQDPSVIDVISAAVKRHPNLIKVTVGDICSEPLIVGVMKGVLQKADVQKVDVMKSLILDHSSKAANMMDPKRKYGWLHILSCSGFTFDCILL